MILSLIIGLTSWLGFTGFYKIMMRLQYNQRIYTLAPQHHQAKQVPSLGGGIMLLMLVVYLPYSTVIETWVILAGLVFGLIGLADDLTAIYYARNKGLSVWQKLSLQGIATLLVLALYPVPVSLFGIIITGISLLAMSNAANLTDGLDGLLAGISAVCMLTLAVITQDTLWLIWLTIILAFLAVNYPPARLFMGDTGAMAIGATLGTVPLVYHAVVSPQASAYSWLVLTGIIMIFFALFILETLSVILQVVYYKYAKKRLFLMAPLHHHFELKNYSETTIMLASIALQVVLSCVSYLSL